MQTRSGFYTTKMLGIGAHPGDTRLQIPAWENMVGWDGGGVRVGLEVEQWGGEMVDLDRNWVHGLDLERR